MGGGGNISVPSGLRARRPLYAAGPFHIRYVKGEHPTLNKLFFCEIYLQFLISLWTCLYLSEEPQAETTVFFSEGLQPKAFAG